MKLVAVGVTAIVVKLDGTREHYELHKEFETLKEVRSYVEVIQSHAWRNFRLELCHVAVWGLCSHDIFGSWAFFGSIDDGDWETYETGWFFEE